MQRLGKQIMLPASAACKAFDLTTFPVTTTELHAAPTVIVVEHLLIILVPG